MKNTDVPPVAVFGTVQKVNEIKHKMGIRISTTNSEKEKSEKEKNIYTGSEETFRIGGRDENPTVSEEEKGVLKKNCIAGTKNMDIIMWAETVCAQILLR